MEKLEIYNSLKNNLDITKEQQHFLDTKLGSVINRAINIGLKYVLPDIVEDEIITVKDTMLKNGLSEGIKEAINSAIDLGKSAVGIVTGNFESINQMQNAVKHGGIIDSVSQVIDTAINKGVSSGKISTSISKTIQKGKNTILDTISNNIEKEFQSQLNSIEKLEKYTDSWKNYYENKDFEGMQKEYNKIQEKLKDIFPIEKTIKNARNIVNLHNLIKNKGKIFELSEEELQIAQKI